jgi:hypothetical protein
LPNRRSSRASQTLGAAASFCLGVEKLSPSLGRFRAVKVWLIIIFVMENPACHAGGRGFAAGALDSEETTIKFHGFSTS